MRIVKYPDPVLFKKCVPVESFDADIGRLLDGMKDIMSKSRGIGLAANQVGVPFAAFVAYMSGSDKTIEFINPEIIESEGVSNRSEGCLSAPGTYVQVPRSERIVVKAKDRFGVEFVMEAKGIDAVCIQHENDHLGGVFFLDKTSRQQRRAALRELEKRP